MIVLLSMSPRWDNAVQTVASSSPIDLVFCLTIFEDKIEEVFNEIVYIASLGLQVDICTKIVFDLLRPVPQPIPS